MVNIHYTSKQPIYTKDFEVENESLSDSQKNKTRMKICFWIGQDLLKKKNLEINFINIQLCKN